MVVKKTLKQINAELRVLYKQLREAKRLEAANSGVSVNTVRPSTTIN
jgi:hypothetical protein